MGKHRGQPANEPGKDLFWNEDADLADKVANFKAYDEYLVENAPEDKSNPYSKENFNG